MMLQSTLKTLSLFLTLFAALWLASAAQASHTEPPSSVVIAGSLQKVLGCTGDWTPDCELTTLTFNETHQPLAAQIVEPEPVDEPVDESVEEPEPTPAPVVKESAEPEESVNPFSSRGVVIALAAGVSASIAGGLVVLYAARSTRQYRGDDD